MFLDRYPRDPEYGAGAFRRRIRLTKDGQCVLAMLDDNHHAMWCRLHHNGRVAVRFESAMLRVPLTTCPAAAALLDELIGLLLSTDRNALFAGGRARRHCTHLFDIAALAFLFATAPEDSRTIDVLIPDNRAGRLTVSGMLNSEPALEFVVEGERIVCPPELADQHLKRGFVSWASARFDGVLLDVALMMQKAFMVAEGWPYLIDRQPGRRITDAIDLAGACFSYTEPRFSEAREVSPHVIDFSNGVIEASVPLGVIPANGDAAKR